jgi:hypothetical protein
MRFHPPHPWRHSSRARRLRHTTGLAARSQRVLLRVKALIHVVLAGKETQLEVTTLSVNTHGALVAVNISFPVETKLVLEHGGTRERVACRVVRPPRETPEGFHTALGFSSSAPDFWKIAFPPTDWMPIDS